MTKAKYLAKAVLRCFLKDDYEMAKLLLSAGADRKKINKMFFELCDKEHLGHNASLECFLSTVEMNLEDVRDITNYKAIKAFNYSITDW